VREGTDGPACEARSDGRGEVDPVVDEEEVALANEGRHHGRDGGDAERVDDGLLGAEEGGQRLRKGGGVSALPLAPYICIYDIHIH